MSDEAIEVIEVDEKTDLTIRQLVVWRSLGHTASCLCHMCIPLRAALPGMLDLVDYYSLRYGEPSALLAGVCHHGVLTSTDCEQCEGAWLSGSGTAQPNLSIGDPAPTLLKKE